MNREPGGAQLGGNIAACLESFDVASYVPTVSSLNGEHSSPDSELEHRRMHECAAIRYHQRHSQTARRDIPLNTTSRKSQTKTCRIP
jgi:hypothetical protein